MKKQISSFRNVIIREPSSEKQILEMTMDFGSPATWLKQPFHFIWSAPNNMMERSRGGTYRFLKEYCLSIFKVLTFRWPGHFCPRGKCRWVMRNPQYCFLPSKLPEVVNIRENRKTTFGIMCESGNLTKNECCWIWEENTTILSYSYKCKNRIASEGERAVSLADSSCLLRKVVIVCFSSSSSCILLQSSMPTFKHRGENSQQNPRYSLVLRPAEW